MTYKGKALMITFGNRRYCTPIAMQQDGANIELRRIPFSQKTFDEGWLQELIYKQPHILPVTEIEPFFTPLIPLGREIPVGTGAIDNLFINLDGYLTIVETKLWRNPEARRKVVAQIIDYAQSLRIN